MNLSGISKPLEYPMKLSLTPRILRPGDRVDLAFTVKDPKTSHPVSRSEPVHEKLLHMFIVSQDLSFFVHEHLSPASNGRFHYQGPLPKSGIYRVLADYYSNNGTPQSAVKTIFVPGTKLEVPELTPDLVPKRSTNLEVELRTEPAEPIAGRQTMLFFRLKPSDGLDQYLETGGHMLAASDDLIDLIHTCPFLGNGGPQVQFNVIFPRARAYRLWVQFQRKGVVNTAVFTLPVSAQEFHGSRNCAVGASCTWVAGAHDGITTQVTYSREISRLMYNRCVMCHRKGGRMFSMMTFEEARHWAEGIMEEVLARRMPPWGAIRGFGEFQNDRSLTQKQIELIADWVEGGTPEGDPKYLTQPPEFAAAPVLALPSGNSVRDGFILKKAVILLGIRSGEIWQGRSLTAVAERPDGSVEPLIWLYDYKPWFAHPYWYSSPIRLPAGTRIVISPADAGELVLLTKRARK
jgi:hypothetical protein